MAHTHSTIDSDKHFIIDPVTREIENESGKVVLMQYDHNSERFTFELPKTIEGHDMSQCNVVQVHYINLSAADGMSGDGLYEVDDLAASGDKVTCSWLISSNATQFAGSLSFLLRFSCVDDDGTVTYAWHTNLYKGVFVSNGLNNAEAVVAAGADILEKWREDLEQWREDVYLASVGQGVSVEEVRDILGIVAVRAVETTLPAAGWAANAQTIPVTGVTPYNVVVVTHAPESDSAYIGNGVSCSAQGSGTLTFKCALTPTADININAIIFE